MTKVNTSGIIEPKNEERTHTLPSGVEIVVCLAVSVMLAFCIDKYFFI